MIKSTFQYSAATLRTIKFLTIGLFILGCQPTNPIVDISDVEFNLPVKRLEKALFTDAPTPLTPEYVNHLHSDFANFYELYVAQIISVGRAEDSATVYYLNHFQGDPQVREIADKVMEKFPDVNSLESELTEAFKRFNVLFPEKEIPDVYTFISAFSYTLIVDDNILGIGLDMYLGRNDNYYQRLGIPVYRIRRMEESNITTDCMRAWISTEFELPSTSTDLISHMIYHGKVLYALDLLLPNVPDSIKIGFTSSQMKWVEENQKDIWFHLANQDLFYGKDPKEITKYVGEAPFTPGFPEGSPGMTGRWVGWQIVKKYMSENNPLNLEALFLEEDANKILTESRYKPE